MTTETQARQLEQVIYTKKDGVATIVMNNPRTLNALSRIMNDEMQWAFLDAENDPDIRAIIVSGAGERAFSSGADVTMMAEGQDRAAADRDAAARAGRVVDVPKPGSGSPLPQWIWRNIEKPIVAAVNGVCAGMGGVTALAADIRIMSSTARFAHVYERRGMVCSGETWFLPRYMGLGNAMYHILMADDTGPDEALRVGLVSKVVEPDKLMEEALAIAEHLRDGPQVATRWTKKVIRFGIWHNFFETMDLVGIARQLAGPSGENREGARSFVEKRKPAFYTR
ncbi:MAG: enoyl-CoA hydratase/isomerase family protein [Chloroflexi bacterium]|nr:enoyl-CoA hydratase/isomerase family protein [Chloroflexota bacterium]